MKRFRLIYNGVTSEFNAVENGCWGDSGIIKGHIYKVRPSKTNTLSVSTLYMGLRGDIHFNCRTRVKRGLKVECYEIY